MHRQWTYEKETLLDLLTVGGRATPEYPPAALAAGFEGTVTVAALINEDGSIGVVEVVDSTNPKLGFEEAALDAFRQFRFAPAVQDGEPVFSMWAYSFEFSSPRGRLNPSPYVSGTFMISAVAGVGPYQGSKVGQTTDNRGISTSGKRMPWVATPGKPPCTELMCKYDKTKVLPIRHTTPRDAGKR